MLKLKQPDPDEVLEKANDLNAPLMPANDGTGFRALTEEEKENFMGSLDAKGRRMLADLESHPNVFGVGTTKITEGAINE